MSILETRLNAVASRSSSVNSEASFKQLKEVAQRLGVLKSASIVITVGGTNGKGSSVYYLDAIYRNAGFHVGRFISPHLFRFNERIAVDDQLIDDTTLLLFLDQIDEACGDVTLNYFQYALLAALLWFKSKALDVIILEVGIGGRLDPTNILDAEGALISTVSLDHCDKLGATRELIAIEKAGIFRKGQRAVCGDLNPPKAMIDYAKSIGAQLYCLGSDFQISMHESRWDWKSANLSIKNLPQSLSGWCQNMAAVLELVSLFQDQLPVSETVIRSTFERIRLPWRNEQLNKAGITWLLDVGHNPEATQALASRVKSLPITGKIYALCGFSADKDILGNLTPLVPLIDVWLPVTLSHTRAMQAKDLKTVIESQTDAPVFCFDSPDRALEYLQEIVQAGDLIVLFGSCYLPNSFLRPIISW